MSDHVNPQTGEVEQKGPEFVIRRGAELLDFQPTNPAQMEYFIRSAVGTLEEMPDVLLQINERRYEAERAYSKAKNSRMAKLGQEGVLVSFARAQAEVDALPELEAWHTEKAAYHYAEDTERALRTKVNAMLNINRAIAAQFGAHR